MYSAYNKSYRKTTSDAHISVGNYYTDAGSACGCVLQDTNIADFEFSEQEYLEDIDTTLALTLQGNKKGICSIGESQSP